MSDAGSCQPLSGLDVYVFIQLGGKCVFSMLLAYDVQGGSIPCR